MHAGRRRLARRRAFRMRDRRVANVYKALTFDSLSDRLAGVFDKLRGRGALSELDVRAAVRGVRIGSRR